MKNLNKKEAVVMNLVLEGYNNKEIALELNYSISTIKAILTETYKKLGVENRIQAAIALLIPPV